MTTSTSVDIPEVARAPRRLLLLSVVAVLALVGIVSVYLLLRSPSNVGVLTLSGTIEATQVRLASETGGQVQEVDVREGSRVKAQQRLARLYTNSTNQNVVVASPLDGVVLERLVEPGELATPDTPLFVVANLDALTLKVYVPENRTGVLVLGGSYPVTVDAFPNQTFTATLSHLADQAQFTPRNVQTVEGRQSTVFAATLDLTPSAGLLKPGMPADVHLAIGQTR
jgi:membrane fusion protein YbhG